MIDVEGTLITPNKGDGFLRSEENGFVSSNRDVRVPRNLINRLELRPGWSIKGKAKKSKGGRRKKKRRGRKKRGRKRSRLVLKEIESVDGKPLEEVQEAPDFARLTSIIPERKYPLGDVKDESVRVIDLVAPIARGQRSLIVAPPRTGKTMLLQKLARAIHKTAPEAELNILLIDERPEEVTDMKRNVPGRVYSSSLDKNPERHIDVVELVFEKARRGVEEGRDIVIFLDSLTRMARAFNNVCAGSGRTLSGGLDAKAMQKPREFFGAARETEESGSLTIIATVLIDTGSKMDQVIFEEFKGTGNMELVLDRRLSDRRIWPAINIGKSGTRHEERLRDGEGYERVGMLRRAIIDADPIRAMERLIERIKRTKNNDEFLRTFGER